jgi:hypothetical protein
MEKEKKTRKAAAYGVEYQIARTKTSLTPSNLYETVMGKKKRRSFSLHEYGQNLHRGPIIAWSIVLLIKLTALYVYKALRWPLRQRKRD